MTATAPRVRWGRRVGLVIVLIVAVTLLVVLAAAAWLGGRALSAKAELEQVQPLLTKARTALAEGDLAALGALTTQAHAYAQNAADLTGDDAWRALGGLPWIGADTTALHTVAVTTADLSDAVTPVADAITGGSSGLSGIAAVVERAAGPMQDLSATLAASDAQLEGLTSPTVPALADAVAGLRSAIADATPVVAQAAQLTGILPAMLGADGPRHLLFLLQNPAEARTGGGITGSFLLFTAQNGGLVLSDQVDSSSFRQKTPAGAPAIPAGLRTLYGGAVDKYVLNTTMTADFDLTARLATAWWATQSDVAPDAVISIDPIVLQPLLALTGPVDVPKVGELTSENLVHELLRAPYDHDSAAQTVLQRRVTDAAFAAILSRDLDASGLWRALTASATEGRISVWSAHPDEQAVLAVSPLGGPAARHAAAGAGAFTVALNDATGGKMDTMLHTSIESGAVTCRDDGRAEAVVRVTLRSGVDKAVVTTLSPWMTGAGHYGVRPGDIGTTVAVAAPAGWFYGGVTRDGELVVSANADDAGFPTTVAASTVGPGASDTLEFRFIAPAPGTVDVTARTSPLVNAAARSTLSPACR